MNVPLIIVACFAAIAFHVEALGADRAQATNPSDVGTVRVFARGQGSLGPGRPVDCSATSCPDHLYVRFDHGTPRLRGSIDVPIDVQPQADPFTLCNKFKGIGALGDLTVEVFGDICARAGSRYSLSASMQVFDSNTNACGCEDTFAATGRLEMFGAIKTFGPGGLPYTIESIATFVGGAGRPAICCP